MRLCFLRAVAAAELGGILVMPLTGAAGGQRPKATVIPDAPSCAECSVSVTPVFSVGGARLAGKSMPLPTSAAVDRAKRYWFLGLGGALMVFDSTGQDVGPVGAGRGQARAFRHPYDVVPVGDSVLVIDPAAGSAAIIGPDLAWVRDIKFEIPVSRLTVIKWPEMAIGSGLLSTTDAAGWSLHRISMGGNKATLLSSFGSGDGQLLIGHDQQVYERIVLAPSGGFWSFRRSRYQLGRWDEAGRLSQILERRPSWFPDTLNASIGGPRAAPTPVVSDVDVDSAGLLWVFVSVPSETWPSAWPPVRQGLVEVPASSIAFDKLYRTVIEVIDPAKGQLIVRSFVNGWIAQALPGHRAITYGPDSTGRRQVTVVSLTLNHSEVRRQ